MWWTVACAERPVDCSEKVGSEGRQVFEQLCGVFCFFLPKKRTTWTINKYSFVLTQCEFNRYIDRTVGRFSWVYPRHCSFTRVVPIAPGCLGCSIVLLCASLLFTKQKKKGGKAIKQWQFCSFMVTYSNRFRNAREVVGKVCQKVFRMFSSVFFCFLRLSFWSLSPITQSWTSGGSFFMA